MSRVGMRGGSKPVESLPWHVLEDHFFGRELSSNRLAQQIGCNPSTIRKWRARGHLPVYLADHVAVALGWHPGDIWPEWWTE